MRSLPWKPSDARRHMFQLRAVGLVDEALSDVGEVDLRLYKQQDIS
jgi:hypothetical protein